MGAGTEGLAEAVRWVWTSGLVWILGSVAALFTPLLAVRVWTGRGRGSPEAGSSGFPAMDTHVFHSRIYPDATCGQCAETANSGIPLMSLTEAMSAAPWPPYREMPDDVMREINYVSYDETLTGRMLALVLRSGERVRIMENFATDLNAEVVQAVRKVQRNREQAALDATADVTTPLGAELALSLLDMAATRQTGCPCCGTFAEGGCVLPPGADATDPAYRCTGYDLLGEGGTKRPCQCWGGPDRECEDCWLSSK